MSFLSALLASISIFLIYHYSMELFQKRKENKFSLYDDITSVYENEAGSVKPIEARSLAERIEVMLESSNLPLDIKEFLIICASLYIFVGYMAGAFLGSLFLGIICGGIPILIFYFYMQNIIKNRNKKIVQQLPEFAIIFASGYDTGYSIENCFDYCSKELRYPIKAEMADIYSDITEKKLSLVDALKNWYDRNPNTDILFVIKGLLLCQEKSGDVSEIMKSLQEKLRDRASIDRFIQKRTQSLRYVAKFIQAVPIGSLAVSYLASPIKFMQFAGSVFGIIGLSFCLFLYIFGTWLINRFISNVYKD